MKSKNTVRNVLNIIMIVIVLGIAVYGIWFYFIRPNVIAAEPLTASGTVETTEINVVPQQSGKVIEVDASEGDIIKAGAVLFKLDNTLLNAQRAVSMAALDTAKSANATAQVAVTSAQTQYDTTLTNALNADKKNRISYWKIEKPSEFDQPSWYFLKSEQMVSAQAELDAANADLVKAQDNLKFVVQKNAGSDFLAAETRLSNARIAFQNTQDVLDQAGNSNLGQDLHDEAKDSYDAAKLELDHAQDAYDQALTEQAAKDIKQARAKLEVAQERVDSAQDKVRAYETGADSPQVKTAQIALDQAKASADQSASAVKQAQANLDLIDAQISLNTITAPVDGIILTRNSEMGTVVSPGAIMMTMGTLDHLTITVYVPEDQIGKIKLAQAAKVTVDSFPGETFKATVSYISDQAEFTPRNVQTVSGRKNTVFAVKLTLEDTTGKLKPGMPADVDFDK
jgi:HlyD family secretion protein